MRKKRKEKEKDFCQEMAVNRKGGNEPASSLAAYCMRLGTSVLYSTYV